MIQRLSMQILLFVDGRSMSWLIRVPFKGGLFLDVHNRNTHGLIKSYQAIRSGFFMYVFLWLILIYNGNIDVLLDYVRMKGGY